jgi:glyceraldehyde 3-phosphate dehydrogenase
VAQVSWEPSAEEVNAAFNRAAEGALKDILDYFEALLVSSDLVGNPASWIFDSQLTMSVARTVKVLGWYDNEWVVSNPTAALVRYIGGSL